MALYTKANGLIMSEMVKAFKSGPIAVDMRVLGVMTRPMVKVN